jgi:hypothetical protein
MIAELKKTQVIPKVIDYVSRHEFVAKSRTTTELPMACRNGKSVWLPLEEETAGESVLHGMLIGAAGAAVIFGMSLTLDLATRWNEVSAWIGSLLG